MGKQARAKTNGTRADGAQKFIDGRPSRDGRPCEAQESGPTQEKAEEAVRYFSSLGQAVEKIWPFRPYLLAVASSKVGRHCVAEEVTQEAVKSALRAWDTFRGNCKLKTWLTRIVCNKCADYWRRQERRCQEVTLEPALAPGSTSWWSDPVRVAENQDLRALIGNAVSRMTPKEHEAFVLCDLKGATRQSAASRMGVTRPALRASLHRARERLKRAIEGSEFRHLVCGGGRARTAARAGFTKRQRVSRKRQPSPASPQVPNGVRPWVDDS